MSARDSKVRRVVYSASSSAYGDQREMPIVETMPTAPISPYALNKLVGEQYCYVFSKCYGLETVNLRYFNVYGERQPTEGQYAPVIGLFQKQIQEEMPITVIGDGLQTRDFTNVKDVVEANILAATTDNNKALGQVFNIGAGKRYSILDLVDMIDCPREESTYINLPERMGEARDSLADNSKAREILGWEPSVDLEEWLNESADTVSDAS